MFQTILYRQVSGVMMSKNDDLEALKANLRITIGKVEAHYREMYKDLPDYRQDAKIRRATKSLMTRVLNGTS